MPERFMTDEKDENMDVLLKLKKTRYNNLLLLYWEREVRGLKFLKKKKNPDAGRLLDFLFCRCLE